jgi:uncharacterized coiled-coil protein SlyX
MASFAAFLMRLLRCEQRASVQHRMILQLRARVTQLEQQIDQLQGVV